jgi:pyruvate dehydrogenase E2 component (dihydrolipoamide acetyltransferase)
MTAPGSASVLVLTLPRLGETMEEGRVVAWAKRPGERFRRGETLLDVETDKTVVEVPAVSDGLLLRTLVAPGDTVAVDAPIAEIETEGERLPPAGPAPRAAPDPGPAGPSRTTTEVEPAAVREIRAAPGARRLARLSGVPLEAVHGTGRLGRVTRADVETTLASEAATGTAAAPSAEGSALGVPRFVEVPGGRLHCRVWDGGEGPPVLLVHGFGGDVPSWAGLGFLLRRAGRSVVAVDLPGHGRSDAPGDTPEELASALATAMAALGLDRTHVVGHSLGGALAVMLAGLAPGRVAGLSLLAPVGFGTELDQGFIDGMLGAATADALAREIAKLSHSIIAVSDALLEAALARLSEPRRNRQLRALARSLARDGVQQVHVAPRLDGLACPIRVAWGREDAIIPWRHALAAPGRAALHLFRGAGHVPHWDRPDEIADLLSKPPQ